MGQGRHGAGHGWNFVVQKKSPATCSFETNALGQNLVVQVEQHKGVTEIPRGIVNSSCFQAFDGNLINPNISEVGNKVGPCEVQGACCTNSQLV